MVTAQLPDSVAFEQPLKLGWCVSAQFKQRLEGLVNRGGPHPKMGRLQTVILAHFRGRDPVAEEAAEEAAGEADPAQEPGVLTPDLVRLPPFCSIHAQARLLAGWVPPR